ncbi:MAG: transcriptional repressor LexA [Thermoflexales bacterium]|nr:transcriptional repressor LexA [Thermoflexales bacterium]MDW8352386.1 transcriptional repressor LexA [Anaerolineae bacterium]
MSQAETGQLTEPQQRILSFISHYLDEHDVPPTIREIQKGAGISSTSMVSYHLKALERANLLNRYERRSRGVVLTHAHRPNPRDIVSVPIVGRIVASEPAPTPDPDALADVENTIQIARSLVGNAEGLYALEVQGDSMIDALINDGDIVIMRRTDEIQNGDLAAVFLTDRNESTLKRVYREKDGKRLKLKPENPHMKPFYVDARHAMIQGKVMCVIRRT